MLLGVGHDLAIAGMIGGLDRNDAFTDSRVVFAQIFGKFRLGAGWANDQDFAGIADGVHDLRKEFLVEPGMTAANRIGLVVKVSRRQMGMQSDLVGTRQADMEDLGL